MHHSTLQRRVALTGKVFDGTISRTRLDQQSKTDKVFVAAAIMWVVRDVFGVDNEGVLKQRGDFNRFAQKLTNKSDGRADTRLMLDDACDIGRRIGLYKPINRGGQGSVKLDPAPDIRQAFDLLTHTPAIDALLQQAAADHAKDPVLKHLPPFVGTEFEGITTDLAEVKRRYGYHGLILLRDHLNRLLLSS